MTEYVSKNAVLDVLRELHGEQTVSKYLTHAQCMDVREGIEKAMHAVEDMQVVDVEPIKYGGWIDGAFENSKRCSVCGKYATKIHNYNEPIFDYVLCPYCGAKMGGR